MGLFSRKPKDPQLRFDAGPALAPPEIWFGPAPATDAWPQLFDAPMLSLLAAHISTIELYFLHLIKDSTSITHGTNTWERLRELDALAKLSSAGLKLAVELGAHKPWLERGGVKTSPPADVFIGDTHAIIANARELGGDVHVLDLDEPLSSGLHLCTPAWPIDRIVDHVVTYVSEIRQAFPAIRISLTEPYPSVRPEQMLRLTAAAMPDWLTLDIDLNALKEVGLRAFCADITALHSTLRDSRVGFGITVWGHDERNAATWVASAKRLLAWTQSAVGRDWPELLGVQSWSPDGQRPRDMPRTFGTGDTLQNVLETSVRATGTP